MSNLIGVSDDFEQKFFGKYYGEYCRLQRKLEDAILFGGKISKEYSEELKSLSKAVLKEKTVTEAVLFMLYREANRLNNDYLDASDVLMLSEEKSVLDAMIDMGITTFSLREEADGVIPQLLSENWMEDGEELLWAWDSNGEAYRYKARIFKKAE